MNVDRAARRVVFLDVDGVLNCASRWAQLPPCGPAANNRVDPEAVARLKRILDATGADVVVSSAWRIEHMQVLVAFLATCGIPRHRVVGHTPRFGSNRGLQIAHWLRAHDEVGPFVILDDASDMGRLLPWLVQTTWDDGLQDAHVDAAIAMLERNVRPVLR